MHEWMGLSCRGFCFVGHPRREAPRTSGVEAIRCVDSGHLRVTPRRPTPRPGSPVHAVHSGRGGAGRGEARVNTRSTATVCSTNSQTRGVKMKVRSRIKNIILKNNPLCFLSNVFYHFFIFFFEMKCYAPLQRRGLRRVQSRGLCRTLREGRRAAQHTVAQPVARGLGVQILPLRQKGIHPIQPLQRCGDEAEKRALQFTCS